MNDQLKVLHVYAVVVAVATFLLVIAGGLVTSTGSALAVPDWPLANGQVFPPMVGGVLFEHGHRLIAATVGLLTVVLAIWLWGSTSAKDVKRLGLAAVGLVVAQGLLGGLTVLLKLPPLVSVAHACLGQVFFCTNVCIAVLTGLNARLPLHPKVSAQAAKLRRLGLLTVGFIFLQLIVGAIYRHTGLLFHVHLFGALLVTVHVLLLARRVFKEEADQAELYTPALLMSLFLGVQLVLGFLAWRMGGVPITTAHVGAGALILASAVVVTLQAYRRLQPA